MATSSIFTPVVLDTEKKVQAFVEALEKAEKFVSHNEEPFIQPHEITTDDELEELFRKVKRS